MFAWAVGVSLVVMLLLIWSALYRESLRTRNARERRPAQPEHGNTERPHSTVPAEAPKPADGFAERAAKQAAGK